MTNVEQLDDGLHCIDLHFQGEAGVIACYLLQSGVERALIEIGPGSTLDALLAGLEQIGVEPASIGKIIVTHIHLDHAGAAGSWMQRYPNAQLYVHEIGAPHMIDPSKLLASATRIYGDRMDVLWGNFLPVPENQVHVMRDVDCVNVGEIALRVHYTPGHASHHVALHDPARNVVFTGDVAGVRLPHHTYVRPPTPPPDLDLDLWRSSVQLLLDLKPSALLLTHFGKFTDGPEHLTQLPDRLDRWAQIVADGSARGEDRRQLTDALQHFGDREISDVEDHDSATERYELATPYNMSVDGFLRYFRKRPSANNPPVSQS